MFINNNRALFHLWWKENLLKHQRVSKYENYSGFTYSACGPLSKNKERIQKFKETENTKYIYRNELDKACW